MAVQVSRLQVALQQPLAQLLPGGDQSPDVTPRALRSDPDSTAILVLQPSQLPHPHLYSLLCPARPHFVQ